MSLGVVEELEKVKERIKKPEHLLAKELLQPFTNTNSSSRKIMVASHFDQTIGLCEPEVPLVGTGYEDEYGRNSSSYVTADDDYTVVAIIPKFESLPQQHYYMLLKHPRKNKYHLVERISYHHITEAFGYMINNRKLDSLHLGSTINKDEVIQSSTGYSDHGNKMNGVNLLTSYMSIHETTEDGFVISETASRKLTAPLIHNISIVINDNDIPLNLYGDDINYKSFPDIGECVNNRILCAIRREKKQESLYTLSWDRLKDILMSDEKFTVDGRIIDINIACNNPEGLSKSFYNTQLLKYYESSMSFSKRIFNILNPIVNNQLFECSYDLLKVYQKHKMILDGAKWMKDKPFSNVVLNIVVLEHVEAKKGDKITDRYGGKGVITEVRPDDLMPMIADTGEIVELIINDIGPVGRQNPGQLFELSTNFIKSRLTQSWSGTQDTDHYLDEYLLLLKLTSPTMYAYVAEVIAKMDTEEKQIYVEELMSDMYLSLEPISESMDITKLQFLYDAFPHIKPYDMLMPQLSSDGSYRMVPARRKLVVGKKYIIRLKQNAISKASATSLSSTNIKNEPAKSKANKIYKAPYAKTPVRFGEMETGDMLHFINVYPVVENLMLHSTSPTGRRRAKDLLTSNPFDVDISLGDEDKNRNVEILNAYLKTIGLRIVFKKIKNKRISPIRFDPIEFNRKIVKHSPITFLGKGFAVSPITMPKSPISFQVIKFTR